MPGYNDRISLIKGIYTGCESIEQRDRLVDCFDKYPSFAASLDAWNFEIPRARIAKALNDGDLTQADYDLVKYHLDVGEGRVRPTEE